MNIFSLNWWTSIVASTCVTMLMIYLIKKATQKIEIPVVSQIAQEV